MVESSGRSWSRVDAILAEALERPEADRRRWVRETCADDPELAAEVLRLLDLGSREDGALDSGRLDGLWQDAVGALEGTPLEPDPGPGPGQRIGPYELLHIIGRGGMGTVYRARDATLGREVAVKALAGTFSADPSGLKRFAREARLLASLNHPNIATIYDLLEFEGRSYLILELVEGETLADRISRGPMPFEECVRVARQLAEALEEAHGKGVVHRDLKPSNVKLTAEGRVKVLDFGLAKSQAPPSPQSGSSPSAATTRSGLVLGTPAYMSPEQARGHTVDLRTDIWSFGCLLYEMLSGERAFRGGSGFDVVASVLRDEVAWAKLPAGLPAGVHRLLRRCLEKPAAARPQAFSEVRHVLEEATSVTVSGPRFLTPPPASWRPVLIAAGLALTLALAAVVSLRLQREGVGSAEPAQLRIAVLPFRSLDPGEADEYLADGLTEDLISQLGRVQPARLTVIARHSAMTYKGSDKQIDEIARELPVQYVVDGSVRRQGEQLRITSRLVRVSDQATLWTESYNRRMGDLLALQAEVAGEIARRIRISVAPPPGGGRVATGSVAPAAYDAYLRGRYHQQRGSSANTARALEEFEKAVALEPGFALAWAGLSRARIFSSTEPAEAQALARHAAQQAVDIDASSSEARIALGLVRLYADWDWEGARRELESAAALDPGNPEGHFYLAQALGAAGRLDEAVAAARRAQDLDPFSPLIRHYVGRFFYYKRDYDAAIQEYRQAIDLDPGYPWSELFLSLTFEQTGRFEESMRHRQRALSLMGAPPRVAQELGEIFAAEGYDGVLRRRAADAEARVERIGYVTSSELAQVWLRLGETERALDWLERAFEDHTRDLIYLGVEPACDPLRGQPRFEALLGRMGKPAVADAADPAA